MLATHRNCRFAPPQQAASAAMPTGNSSRLSSLLHSRRAFTRNQSTSTTDRRGPQSAKRAPSQVKPVAQPAVPASRNSLSIFIGALLGTAASLSFVEYYTSKDKDGRGTIQQLLNGKTSNSVLGRPNLAGYLATLRQVGFNDDQVSTDESDLETHGHSPWSYHPARNPSAVVYPSSIEQVQDLVRQAPLYGVVLVPFAGGTSLEAHWAAPPEHPTIPRTVVCVDFALMDAIGECNIDDGDIEVEAGVKYEDLNQHLADKGYKLFFPVDPGPGAAFGGMLATGGSGPNAVRYGTMKGDYIINVTVVLANGQVIQTRSRSRKSAVGPDLTKLFLGSEGTLGMIVKVRLRLAPVLPTSIVVVPFPNIRDACNAAQQIVARGVGIQCVELLDDVMIDVVNKANAGDVKPHIVKPSLFIKLQGSESHRREDERVITEIARSNRAEKREIQSSHDVENNERLWRARKVCLWSALESMPPRKEYADKGESGWAIWTTDVCVPLGSMAALFEKVKQDTVKTGLHAPIVGHIGDGGAHSLIVFRKDDEEEFEKVKAFVDRLVQYAHEMDGTASGEHAIGRGKRMYVERELGKGTLELLRSLKHALDPIGIMNPGALLYETDEERRHEMQELQRIAKAHPAS